MTHLKQMSVISAVVLVLVFTMTASMAADPPAGGQAQAGPHMGPGPHGRGVGQAGQGQAGGRLGARGPQGVAPGRGYIEPNAETKALWEKLGKLQADLHEAQWDLFVLMAQKPRDQQKIKAQEQRIKQLRESMRSVWQKLRPHWHPIEPQAGSKPGRGDSRAGQQAPASGKGGK